MLFKSALGLIENLRRHADTGRVLGDAIPDVLDELESLDNREVPVVKCRFGHGRNLGTPKAAAQGA